MTRFVLALVSVALFAAVSGRAEAAPCPDGMAPEACIGTLAQEVDRLTRENDARRQVMAQMENARHSPERQEYIANIKARQDYFLFVSERNQALSKVWKNNVAFLDFRLVAARALLVLVFIVCIAGVLFAGYELVQVGAVHRSLTSKEASRQGETPEDEKEKDEAVPQPAAPVPHSLTISPEKIQLTTAATGIVVLFLSLGFLYLFLHEVYTIEFKSPDMAKQIVTQQPAATGQGE